MNHTAQNRNASKKAFSLAIRGFTRSDLRQLKTMARANGQSMNKLIVTTMRRALAAA